MQEISSVCLKRQAKCLVSFKGAIMFGSWRAPPSLEPMHPSQILLNLEYEANHAVIVLESRQDTGPEVGHSAEDVNIELMQKGQQTHASRGA